MGISQARHNKDMLYIVCDRHRLWAGDQDVYCFKSEITQTIKRLKCEGWSFDANDSYEKVVCGSCHRSFDRAVASIKEKKQTTDYWIKQATKPSLNKKTKPEKLKRKTLFWEKVKNLITRFRIIK